MPPSLVLARPYILSSDPLPQQTSEINKIRTNNRKVLPDPLPQYTSLKITRLVRRLRRNVSSSKIHEQDID